MRWGVALRDVVRTGVVCVLRVAVFATDWRDVFFAFCVIADEVRGATGWGVERGEYVFVRGLIVLFWVVVPLDTLLISRTAALAMPTPTIYVIIRTQAFFIP